MDLQWQFGTNGVRYAHIDAILSSTNKTPNGEMFTDHYVLVNGQRVIGSVYAVRSMDGYEWTVHNALVREQSDRAVKATGSFRDTHRVRTILEDFFNSSNDVTLTVHYTHRKD